MLQRYKLN